MSKETMLTNDWRAFVVRLAKEARLPNNKILKAGHPIFASTFTKNSNNKHVSFLSIMPFIPSLSVAIKAAARSTHLFNELKFITGDPIKLEYQMQKIKCENHLDNKDTPKLYDSFEEFLICVAFSYKAIEDFCNVTIENQMQSPIKYKDEEDKFNELKKFDLLSDSLVELKLDIVLPQLLEVTSPKGLEIWGKFTFLRKLRNQTIHGGLSPNFSYEIDKLSLFLNYFKGNFFKYPKTAMEVIQYFLQKQPVEPDWLTLAKQKLKEYECNS